MKRYVPIKTHLSERYLIYMIEVEKTDPGDEMNGDNNDVVLL